MARVKSPVYTRDGHFSHYRYETEMGHGWDTAKEAERITHYDKRGRGYTTRNEYLQMLENAAYAAQEREDIEDAHAKEQAGPSDAELHMQWALMQDPNMTAEDYYENCERCPGFGPRPQKNVIDKPIGPQKRWLR